MYSFLKTLIAVTIAIFGSGANANQDHWDYIPDPIEFVDGTGEYCYTSNTVTFTGIDTTLDIGISGQENHMRAQYAGEFFYSVDGKEFVPATLESVNEGFQTYYNVIEIKSGQSLALKYCNPDDRVGGYVYVALENLNASEVIETATFRAGAP